MQDSKAISEYNSIITLDYLQNKPEGQTFERKSIDVKPAKLADELIGMLNAEGGILVLGISDNGEIEDLSTLDEKLLNQFRTVTFDYIHPACDIFLEEVFIDDNLIFIYHINQNIEQIFARKDNETVFLRILDTNRKLDQSGFKKLEYDKNIRRFEEEVVKDFDFDDLDMELLQKYKNQIHYKGNELDLLCKRYLAKKQGEQYLLHKSAVLLFAKDPEKYIPSASVRYIRYNGTQALVGTEHNVIKDERFEYNIPTMIDELKKFLRASFKDYFFLDLEQGLFVKVPEYPEEAWLEGIVNALCHRSYNVQGNAIYIKHYDDRIEISNSGPLPAQVTIENIKEERFARNPRVARVLEDMGYVRQLNEGVSRIYETMQKSMLSEPEYKEQNGNVYLLLKNKVSYHSSTIKDTVMLTIEKNILQYNETQQKLLQYLFINNSATVDELSKAVGIKANTLRTYLNRFIDERILEKVTNKERDRNALYRFLKD